MGNESDTSVDDTALSRRVEEWLSETKPAHLRSSDDARQLIRELSLRQKLLADELKEASERNRHLLSALHHRVRNSFNTIIGLLHIQIEMKGGGNQEIKAALDDLERRIQGIVLLHSHLLHPEDSRLVGIRDYLRDITSMEATHFARPDIQVSADVAPVEMKMNIAMPCGLVVNELLSNAYAHAFPAGRGGTILLTFGVRKKFYRLSVSDDGVGLPPGFLVDSCKTMGMRLVSLFAGQLGAELTTGRSNAGGAFFSLGFPQTLAE